tara:strand:+ start:35325 stop:35735 length:411 start_codon:yes stop_codon:yes gene_type:complete
MNRQESRLYYSLSEIQGSYYVFIGIFILFLSIEYPTESNLLIMEQSTSLFGTLLIGIGCSLFIGKNNKKVHYSVCILGLFSSWSIFIQQVSSAYAGESNFLQNIDLFIQLAFSILWLYLLYWKWVNRKFSKLNSED